MEKSCINCLNLHSDVTAKPCSICSNPNTPFSKWEAKKSHKDTMIDIMNNDIDEAVKLHLLLLNIGISNAILITDKDNACGVNTIIYVRESVSEFKLTVNGQNTVSYIV